jgi:hypothetical protein
VIRDDEELYKELISSCLMTNGDMIKYIKNPTQEWIDIAVESDPISMRYLDLTDDYKFNVLCTVNNSARYFKCDNMLKKHVKNKNDRLRLVRDVGTNIHLLNKPTEEESLVAVRSNGLALKFIHIQTEEICMEAVKQNIIAFIYVARQTEKISSVWMCMNRIRVML